MPTVSKKEHNLMEAVAHSPEFAAKAGVPQSVGKDFAAADEKQGRAAQKRKPTTMLHDHPSSVNSRTKP